jgi:hypothetical protein
MGLLSALLRFLFGTKQPAKQLPTQDMTLITGSASRMADIINESLKIARESKNTATRLSRLGVAKQRLAELREMARTYEFLELTSLEEIESEIARIEAELGVAGSLDERKPRTASSDVRTTDSYFTTMTEMQEAISSKQYDKAQRLIRENMRQVPDFVRECIAEYGDLDVSIPVVHQGGKILALMGDDEGLQELSTLVESVPELHRFQEEIAQHREDRTLFADILSAVEQNPQCLQTEVKHLIGVDDGRHVATLISWLEKADKIVRKKSGRTYALALAGTESGLTQPPMRTVNSHRSDKKGVGVRTVDLDSLSYVPLPRAPLRWEEREKGRIPQQPEAAEEYFEVREASAWELAEVDKLPMADRPDPAFRQIHPTNNGLLLIDDLGNSEEFSGAPASALCFDRQGEQVSKGALMHDVYRVGVNTLGRGFIAMSRNCVVHAYDDELSLTLETAMRDAPEVRALQARLEINDDELKNHLRCVSMSHDQSQYMVTGVDEAWCIGMDGRALWGVKLPITEGWSRVADSSGQYDTDEEIMEALAFMQLALPVSPEDVKQRYRELAKKYHPDLNRDDPGAEARMKKLGAAAEALTGVNLSTLRGDDSAGFFKETDRLQVGIEGVELTVSMGIQVGECQAADWIYAAALGGAGSGAYLAGYSGRVIEVDSSGDAVRAYDIGVVPRRIIDTGDYLYILTDTRLYVLRGELLCGVVDTLDGGELIVGQTGFGLLEKKRFRWFHEEGTYLGSVVTKNPIRRVYYGRDGLVVETRQRRALIRGVPAWWE